MVIDDIIVCMESPDWLLMTSLRAAEAPDWLLLSAQEVPARQVQDDQPLAAACTARERRRHGGTLRWQLASLARYYDKYMYSATCVNKLLAARIVRRPRIRFK